VPGDAGIVDNYRRTFIGQRFGRQDKIAIVHLQRRRAEDARDCIFLNWVEFVPARSVRIVADGRADVEAFLCDRVAPVDAVERNKPDELRYGQHVGIGCLSYA
jgi:hypothetical protein